MERDRKVASNSVIDLDGLAAGSADLDIANLCVQLEPRGIQAGTLEHAAELLSRAA